MKPVRNADIADLEKRLTVAGSRPRARTISTSSWLRVGGGWPYHRVKPSRRTCGRHWRAGGVRRPGSVGEDGAQRICARSRDRGHVEEDLGGARHFGQDRSGAGLTLDIALGKKSSDANTEIKSRRQRAVSGVRADIDYEATIADASNA
jgi:hypothetical protein